MDRIGGTSSELLQLLAAHASRAAVRGALEKGMSPLLILLRCGVAALLAAQSVAVAEQNGYLVTNGVVPKGKHHDQRGTEERNEGTEQQALYTKEAELWKICCSIVALTDMSLAEFGRKEFSLAEHERPGLVACCSEFWRPRRNIFVVQCHRAMGCQATICSTQDLVAAGIAESGTDTASTGNVETLVDKLAV